MSYVRNKDLHSFDPFADASKSDDLLAGTEDYLYPYKNSTEKRQEDLLLSKGWLMVRIERNYEGV